MCTIIAQHSPQINTICTYPHFSTCELYNYPHPQSRTWRKQHFRNKNFSYGNSLEFLIQNIQFIKHFVSEHWLMVPVRMRPLFSPRGGGLLVPQQLTHKESRELHKSKLGFGFKDSYCMLDISLLFFSVRGPHDIIIQIRYCTSLPIQSSHNWQHLIPNSNLTLVILGVITGLWL